MDRLSRLFHNSEIPSQRQRPHQRHPELRAVPDVCEARNPRQQPQITQQIPARYRSVTSIPNRAARVSYSNSGGAGAIGMQGRPLQPTYSRPASETGEDARERAQSGLRFDAPPSVEHPQETTSWKSQSSNKSEEISLLRNTLNRLGIGQRRSSQGQTGQPQGNPAYGQIQQPQPRPQQGQQYGYQYGPQNTQNQQPYGRQYGGQGGWQPGAHVPHRAYAGQPAGQVVSPYQPQYQGHQTALQMPPFGGQHRHSQQPSLPQMTRDPALVRRIMEWMEDI